MTNYLPVGGFGYVFVAQDVSTGKDYALKVCVCVCECVCVCVCECECVCVCVS